MTAKTFEILIEVRVDGEEISGHVRDAVGESEPFLGWLGLIAALDARFAHAEPEREEH